MVILALNRDSHFGDSGFIAKAATENGGSLFMFENYKTFKTQFAGRELIVETGKTAS